MSVLELLLVLLPFMPERAPVSRYKLVLNERACTASDPPYSVCHGRGLFAVQTAHWNDDKL